MCSSPAAILAAAARVSTHRSPSKSPAPNASLQKALRAFFYRNAINIGLPIIESPEAVRAIDQGDELEVDLENGVITNLTKNETYHFEKFPEFIQHIVEAGNLLNYVKAKVGQ